MTQILWISIGAVLGANARYFISQWIGGKFGLDFPYGTLVVNASGSLLLGFLAAISTNDLNVSPQLRMLLMVGFLGSYTTFSTFAVESVSFWQHERAWAGLVNIFANNSSALLFAVLGMLLARQLR